MWKHSASMACPSAALHASVFIRAHLGNPWFKIHRTTRFHSSLAFLKLISMPRSSPVPPKLVFRENSCISWFLTHDFAVKYFANHIITRNETKGK
jgi:hypothetical protein